MRTPIAQTKIASAGATRWRMLTPLHQPREVIAQGGGSEIRAVVMGRICPQGLVLSTFRGRPAIHASTGPQIAGFGTRPGDLLSPAADLAAPLPSNFCHAPQGPPFGQGEANAAADRAGPGRHQRKLQQPAACAGKRGLLPGRISHVALFSIARGSAPAIILKPPTWAMVPIGAPAWLGGFGPVTGAIPGTSL